MKLISITKTFRGECLCIPSLESVYPYMHKMIYVHSNVSWQNKNGNTVAPLIEQWKRDNDKHNKIMNVYYDTNSQIGQYEKALETAKQFDYDFLMLVDTDEVWARKDIEAAIKFIDGDKEHMGFKSSMYSYVKSPFYRIVPYDMLSPVVFIRKGAGINGCRGSLTEKQVTIPGIEFHHFCSVRKSFTTVWDKHVASCAEENEPMVDRAEWINGVWNKLPNAFNLLPLKNHTANWKTAERIKIEQLPESMLGDKFTMSFQDYNFNVNYKFSKFGINEKDGVVDYDVVIPTIKPLEEISEIIDRMKDKLYRNTNVIATCLYASAATNRNMGIMECTKPFIILADDDVIDYTPLFAEELVKVLRNDPNAVMVSARLFNQDRTPGPMMGIEMDMSAPFVEVKERALPTACIAIRNDGTMFDEQYVGSGYEDTDFSFQLQEKYPNGKWIVNNAVKVIHLNEMKNQHVGGNFSYNAGLFKSKWYNKNKGERK